MLTEIFMLRLEAAARAAKEAAPHRPDHVAGCESALTRAAASARLLSARPGHAVRELTMSGRTIGNLILMTLISVVVFIVFMAVRPTKASAQNFPREAELSDLARPHHLRRT